MHRAGFTYREIGQYFGVSLERARQMDLQHKHIPSGSLQFWDARINYLELEQLRAGGEMENIDVQMLLYNYGMPRDT